ncbi:hypothetical protein N007_00725 [Alicyclobacillus acidoterrestris ATCC 49025]|nr:hypothetical protein N007_00725 [Alicyclobacillus acidoterrestris ATCC 49025]
MGPPFVWGGRRVGAVWGGGIEGRVPGWAGEPGPRGLGPQ